MWIIIDSNIVLTITSGKRIKKQLQYQMEPLKHVEVEKDLQCGLDEELNTQVYS